MSASTVRFVSLRTVATTFDVEIRWVEEVYEFGLLGAGRREGDEIRIAIERLQRVADVLRWYRQGVNLEGIALLVSRDEPEP